MKTLYSRAPIGSFDAYGALSRQIKYLIPRSIRIKDDGSSLRRLSKLCEASVNDLSHRVYRKKGFSKVRSIKLLWESMHTKSQRLILLMLAKKTKSLPCLYINTTSTWETSNTAVIKTGHISSRVKFMRINIGEGSISLLKHHLKALQKSKVLSQIDVDLSCSRHSTTTKYQRSRLFTHLCRILQNHNLDLAGITQNAFESGQVDFTESSREKGQKVLIKLYYEGLHAS